MTNYEREFSKNFSLDTILIFPENNQKIDKAIILLHGYGGDSEDISSLSYIWKRYLKNTIIICPNGPEKCSLSPSGFQWFDLSSDDKDKIIKSVSTAEKKLIKFIDEVKSKFDLKNKDICLSGFSQGCMMALNIGLISNEKYCCIVGFSGKIIDKENLNSRIKSDANILLIHGDIDDIVSIDNLLDAKDFFLRHKIKVRTKIMKNCGHNIPINASSIALEYIKDMFNIN